MPSNRKSFGKRQASDIDNDAPRPTASAHRQRQQVHIIEYPPTTTKDLNEEHKQPLVEEGITGVEGFPEGPHDTSILRDFENQIALRVQNGEVCKS